MPVGGRALSQCRIQEADPLVFVGSQFRQRIVDFAKCDLPCGFADNQIHMLPRLQQNLDQANAEATIVAADLAVGEISTAHNETVTAGKVISQGWVTKVSWRTVSPG